MSSSESIRKALPAGEGGALLRFWRALGLGLPNWRGKHRFLFEMPSRFVGRWPDDVTLRTRNGVVLSRCDLNQCIYRILYFYGIFEVDVDWMCARLLKPGDVYFDVGACFGCHALPNAVRVGLQGRVYAIEPQPEMYSRLAGDTVANGLTNTEASLMALSDRNESLSLYRFPELDMGHTSISRQGHQEVQTLSCAAVTLDDYIEQHGIGHVTLVKLDVEGAEWKVLKGAEKLLSRPEPPLWIVEVNMTTSQACGYSPQELFALLARHGYSAYRPRWRGVLGRHISRLEACPFDEMTHGQNLLCAIPAVHAERLARVGVRVS